MADYSDDHIGKRVVSQDGVEIGSVEDVRNGDLYVTLESSDADVPDFEWVGQVNQDLHRLPDQYVSNVRENTIRLR